MLLSIVMNVHGVLDYKAAKTRRLDDSAWQSLASNLLECYAKP